MSGVVVGVGVDFVVVNAVGANKGVLGPSSHKHMVSLLGQIDKHLH